MNESKGLVIVTGASSGIGAALAVELHKRGHRLLLVARREDRLLKLQQQLEQSRPNSVKIRCCDLSKRDQVESFASEIKNIEVEGLINNAGVGSIGRFHLLDLTSEVAQLELNVITPVVLTHAVAFRMCQRKSGFIINVSSIMAYQGFPYAATYAASKAFEWRHSRALGAELSEFGVRIMTLCPGPTETEFFGIAKVPGSLKSFKRTGPETVAQQCLRDFDAGKAVSIPTIKAKALVFLAQIVPSALYFWGVKVILKKSLDSKIEG